MLLSFRRLSTAFSPIRVPIYSPPAIRFLSALPLTSSLEHGLNPSKPLTRSELKTLVLSQFNHGKFYDLVQSVIASPSVLLAACRNLKPPADDASSSLESLTVDWISSRFFSIPEMAAQIYENRFDIESCCYAISSPENRGNSLVLPNLKLKVLIEAIRMVLEVIYDDRFVTFSYGGRMNMGRHTAIRYLKNSVENANWWFTVSFNPGKFESKHVLKLCTIIESKIKDDLLINMLKRLIEFEVVKIELGGCNLGRGFPQESGLDSILINIYFHGFDQEIQERRLRTNQENPKLDSNKLVSESSDVFYKPLKIYAVRYLDEILVITSGSKMLTMDLKIRVSKYLEQNLDLNLDKTRTLIHSAVSEKIDFLGMELQAVTPSVLNPPLSEKAIRARKKYLRQKEVKAQELRNARETNRKKLGLKVMTNALKKLKRSDGFKFEFQIENQVREIFRDWAGDVVKEFLRSVEERRWWHRKLSEGDFLSLNKIRESLPKELIDSYDEFQEQVDKYLNPKKAQRALDEEHVRAKEEEEQRYAERTVKDLTKRCIKVDVPIELVHKAVRLVGFTNHMGRPRPIGLLTVLEDRDIIRWYSGVGRRWLEYFSCCHNFRRVKIVVSYHLRFSCLLTLAEKHESTKREAIKHYTKDLKVYNGDEEEEHFFPTEREIKMMGEGNFSDPKPVDGVLTLVLIRLASDEPSYQCAAHFCDRTDTVVYRVRLLQNRLNLDRFDEKKWVRGMGAIHSCLNRKCFPLCSDHKSDFYLGKITFRDIDCSLFVNVD